MISYQKGYYGLIRVCPHPSRQEFFNVGLFLYVPEASYFRAETLDSLTSIASFTQAAWLVQPIVRVSLRAIKPTMQSMFRDFGAEPQRFLESFRFHFQRYANEIRVGEPAPIQVDQPEETFVSLFERTVLPPRRTPSPQKPTPPICQKLERFFSSYRASPHVRFHHSFASPFGETNFEIPYSYRNALWNFVQPVDIKARSKKGAFRQAEAIVTESRLASEAIAKEQGDTSFRLLLVPTSEAWFSTDIQRMWAYFSLESVAPSAFEGWLAEVAQILGSENLSLETEELDPSSPLAP